jgi:hypothetical protein
MWSLLVVVLMSGQIEQLVLFQRALADIDLQTFADQCGFFYHGLGVIENGFRVDGVSGSVSGSTSGEVSGSIF